MVRRASERGFTLIEMAIVVVIIGLLLSGGLLAVSPVLQSSKLSDTNARLERLEQALTVYVIQNGCLPCPADRGLASTSTDAGWSHAADYYGPSHTAQTRGCSNAATCAAFVGVVPWATMGISEADITDAWGNRIGYAVAGGLTQTTTIMQRSGSSYPTVGNQVIFNTAGVSQTTTGAYVLISFGPDMTYANAATTGTVRPETSYAFDTTDASGRNDPANHTAATTPFAQGDFVGTATEDHFDDLVRWRSAPIIIQSCGPGACGNPS